MKTILVVDSDSAHRDSVARLIKDLGYQAQTLGSCRNALPLLARFSPAMILVSEEEPELSWKALLRSSPEPSRVALMGRKPVSERLLEAVAFGACDYLVKPVARDSLIRLLGDVLPGDPPAIGCECLGSEQDPGHQIIAGNGRGMIQALKTAGMAAKTGATVLLCGESGTGKDLFAREIHRVSGRTGAFVAINCAAVAEGVVESELFGHEKGAFTGAVVRRAGCFEQAHGGTLFLDEIGDAPAGFQAKLLRALDCGEFVRLGGQSPVRFDVRVVAATNRDLGALVTQGAFRLDLFYRLSAVSLELPPLRERREDIPEIVRVLLSRLNGGLACRVRGVSAGALERLVSCDWPGNMRQLQHVIYRAALVCRSEVIMPSHLEGLDGKGSSGGSNEVPTLAAVEEAHIKKILGITGGNRGRACQILGISRPTLRRKLRQYRVGQNQEDRALPT